MKVIIRSVALLLLVSSGSALFFSEFDVSFWKSFIFMSILQLVAWNGFVQYQRSQVIKRNKDIEEQFVQNIGKQEVQLPCASCSVDNITLVEINDANTFECTACNQKNAVYINIETAAMTVIED